MDRARLREACRSLPLFPLPGTVLLPGSLLPLHVFEPRYRALVADCLREERPLSVCQIRPEEAQNAAGAPGLLPYAGVGVVTAHHLLPDGRYNILIQPVGRVRLRSDAVTDRLYRVADAELLDDEPVSAVELAAEGERVRRLFGPLVGRLGASGEAVGRALAALPPERVPEALASVVLRAEDPRQRFLAEGSPLRRAALVEEGLLLLLAELSGVSAAEA